MTNKANVTPIFKSGSRNLVENYRPVSLTCTACKLFEHILCSSICSFLDSSCYLSPAQRGFLRGYSCVNKLAEFTHFVSNAIHNKQRVDCIFSKAFDTVPHHLLLEKRISLGIHDKIVNWVTVYLPGSEQSVVLKGKKIFVNSSNLRGTTGNCAGALVISYVYG